MVAEASPDKMETVMSASQKIGPFRVGPFVKNGEDTGKFRVNIPERYSDTGKRRRPLFETCEDALGFARALNRQIEARPTQAAPVALAPRTATVTFRKAASDWKAAQQLRHEAGYKRGNSLATELNRANALIAAFGNKRLDRLTANDVLTYNKSRKEARVQRTTINAELAVLRRILKHAGSAHLAVEYLPKDKRVYQLPTASEVERIVAQLRGRARLAARLMAEAGLRPDEAYNAGWTWFGRDESGKPYVWVQKLADPASGHVWEPKTAPSTRKVPLSEDLYTAILALERTSFWVFPSPADRRFPITSIRKALANAVRRAGVTRNGRPIDLPPKLLRKVFGTRLAAAKVDRSVIQDLVGHERGSPVTEEFYIFLEDHEKQAAVGHARIEPALPNLATAGNGPDSKAALRAFIRSQLAENPG
jgi:integrase